MWESSVEGRERDKEKGVRNLGRRGEIREKVREWERVN